MTEVFRRKTIRPFLWLPAYSDLIRRNSWSAIFALVSAPKTFPIGWITIIPLSSNEVEPRNAALTMPPRPGQQH